MDIAVVGAGLSGLAASRELVEQGHNVAIYEASDGPGGRVRTDVVDGHRLDRGFQILLSAYPEAQNLLDYDKLDLKAFDPGALIFMGAGRHRIGDPLRDPFSLLDTLRAPIGTVADKAKILRFRQSVVRKGLHELWLRDEVTAHERLTAAGFSSTMINSFMKPLFAGITLDPHLQGSSRVLEFVFRMLAKGDAVVPALGMGEIATQLADGLPNDTIHLNSPVANVEPNQLVLESGESVVADAVLVATDMAAAADLTSVTDRGWRGVTSVWLKTEVAPIADPVLVLNGEATGPINSLAAMSNVSPHYAPNGAATVVVSAPEIRPDLVEDMMAKLKQWFGPVTASWEIIRVDEIERSQPRHPIGHQRVGVQQIDGVWVCGDHLQDASINGALGAGRAAAAAIGNS